jgi:hypothetical protein
MATDIDEDEGRELPPPPKGKTKKLPGRPKGRKNDKTLKREKREKAVNNAKALLAKGAVTGKGKKLIDVSKILYDLNFDPIYEAVELYREVDEDNLDPDRRKLMLDLLKFITPFYVPKQKPAEDNATSHVVPIFNIQIGGSHYKQPVIDITPKQIPEAETEEGSE